MNPTAALMLNRGIEEERRRARRGRRHRVANEETKSRVPRISLLEIFQMKQLHLDRSEG